MTGGGGNPMTGGSHDPHPHPYPHPHPHPHRPAPPRSGREPVVVAMLTIAVLGLLVLAGAVVFFWALLAFGGPIG